MKKQIFTSLGLLLVSVVLMAQSQNKLANLEEHKAFKQKLMEKAQLNFENSQIRNSSFNKIKLTNGGTINNNIDILNNKQLPDLEPYRPDNVDYVWDDTIIIKNTTIENGYQDMHDDIITYGDDIYVALSYWNNSDETISTSFRIQVLVDEVEQYSISHTETMDGYWYWMWWNWGIYDLSIGQHAIKMIIDADNDIEESDETNNEFSRTFTIIENTNIADYGDAPDLNWIGQFGSSVVDTSYGYVIGMVADNSANVYTYGYSSHTTNYFGEEVNKGIFICKQNGSGNVIWLKQFADIQMGYGSQGNFINIDKLTSHIYITGELDDELIIPGETTLTPAEGGSIFILKYDLNGNYVWHVQEDFSGEEPSVVPDNSGNVILSGVFWDEITIGTTGLISVWRTRWFYR